MPSKLCLGARAGKFPLHPRSVNASSKSSMRVSKWVLPVQVDVLADPASQSSQINHAAAWPRRGYVSMAV